MDDDEFLQQDFSLDEYLSKILADSSGECSRLKDRHVRMLSKHSEALSGDMLDKKETVKNGLHMLAALIEEAKRISKELPDLFLPLAESSGEAPNSKQHKELEHEVEKIHGDASIAEGRVLKHKEHVSLRIDREEHTGVILVCEDIIILGIDTKDGMELYNAFLIRELTCSMEKDYLVISLPPIRIEVTRADSTLKHLRNKILGSGAESAKTRETVVQKADGYTEEIDQAMYAEYLLRIGRVHSIEDPSSPEIVQGIKSLYSVSQWKGASSLLQLLKKQDLLEAVKLYCGIEGEKLMKAVTGIVHQRENIKEIVKKVGIVLVHYINGLEKAFPETASQGYISLHLEEVHTKTAELVYRSYYISESMQEQPDTTSTALTEQLVQAFTYKEYSFGYTTKVEAEIKKEHLKSRYTFNKQVMQCVFKSLEYS
ncbi:uncharacterized protein NEMAJ01_0147 [Nematocida major]|uniref:uncharacterized protein n=1 Tax=Nematocida major TaxID=1912982 RepID=UPI0020082641|nr:uncharacterized protein NEMAJ01_0147 [Nematocida major]KAH9385251.1 hypothetical protein NEMAJ01_0147 [Nematocida major]